MADFDRKDAAHLGVLCALVIVFFYQFVFSGLIPINADWLHANFEPGRSYLAGVRPHNIELDDPVYQFYPLRMEAVRQWKSGSVPLWNPGILCGNPLLADGISKPLDPLILAQVALGGPVGRGVELLLQFVLMITGMYVLGRGLGLGRAGAATAGVVYTFNLLSVTWMELRTATGAFAFFPWAFLLLFAALESRKAAYAVAAGVLSALMVFAGHPQFVLYAFVIMGAFVAWRAAGDLVTGRPRAALWTLGLGALAVVLALLISAVETVPFLELLGQSARNPRQYESANNFATPLSFLTYIYPNFFGNPAAGAYLGGQVLHRPYMTATAGFVGASTLALVIGGLCIGKCASKRFFICVALGTAVLMLMVGAGLARALLGEANFLAGMDIARAAFASNFALAVLAGAGLTALSRASWGDRRFRTLAVILPLTLAVIVILTALVGRLALPLSFHDQAQAYALRAFLRTMAAFRSNPLMWPSVYGPLAFFAAAGALVFLSADARRLAVYAAGALVTAELMLSGIGYNPFVDARLIAPEFPPASALAEETPHEGRFAGLDTPPASISDPARRQLVPVKGDMLLPNTGMLYGLQDIRGDESLRLDRYYTYMRRVAGPTANLLASIHLETFEAQLIGILNAKWILSSVPLQSDGLEPFYSDGEAFVYRNLGAMPRVRLVGMWRAALSSNDALNMMNGSAAFDPAATVLVEPGEGGLPPEPASVTGGAADITDYKPSRVRVMTECGTDSMLVLADAWYPGWKATVDEEESQILVAYGTLRAVFLPAGAHEVVFSYEPRSFKAGLTASLAGLLAAAGLAAWSLRPRRPRAN